MAAHTLDVETTCSRIWAKLMEHLQEIDATCRRRMDQMIREMALTEGVTEELKAQEQMTWIGKITTS